MTTVRVYCAGPLFNDPERAEMHAIAQALEKAGYETFLPQRDGFELSDVQRQFETSGVSPAQANRLVHRSIFDLDIYHLLQWSHACVANINGRVPDEGTVVDAALTWGAGRPLVLFKSDDRAPFDGEDNPMLSCLTNLQITDSVDAIPQVVAAEIARDRTADVAATLARGHRVADAVSASRESETPTDPGELARTLASIYAEV